MKKAFIATILFSSLGAVFFVHGSAHAAACGITQSDIDRIAAVRNDPTLGYLDEIKQEVVIRKELVGRTIDCAEADVKELQASLAAITPPSGSESLQSQLGDKLSDSMNFYENERAKLDDAGIAGSQAVARELLSWRSDAWLTTAGQVNNYLLWTKNQGLFLTAKVRMDETSRTAAFLESVANNVALSSAVSDAQTAFSAANAANADARSALAQFLPPDRSLPLIKQSLVALSFTYEKFSAVNGLMKELLPQ